MVGRESLPDLEDSLRLVVVAVVVVGAPSCASFLAAPLGPDSRVDVADLSALDDDEEVVDDDDEDDEEDEDATVTSSVTTSATSSTTTVSDLVLSAGLEDGFQVGLWRPDEGDLVGEPAKLRCSTGLDVGGVHRGERPS
jgi:hypothetical protein